MGQVAPKNTTTSYSSDTRTLKLGKKSPSPSSTPIAPPGSIGPKVSTTTTNPSLEASFAITFVNESLLEVKKTKTKTNKSLPDDPIYSHQILDYILSYLQKDTDTFRDSITYLFSKDEKYLLYDIESTLDSLMDTKIEHPWPQTTPTINLSLDMKDEKPPAEIKHYLFPDDYS